MSATGVVSEPSKILSPEEYELWEKAFLMALAAVVRRGARTTCAVEYADQALAEMRSRNPKFKPKEGPYR